MTQKPVSEKMIDLDAEEGVFVIKIIDLDIKMSAEKTIIALVFDIDGSSIYTIMVLMNRNTIVLFQGILLANEICCLGNIIFLLVLCLVNVVTKEQYS